MTTLRLLVTGSRTFGPRMHSADGLSVFDVLDLAAVDCAAQGYTGLTVVHGACPDGADYVADLWVHDRAGRGWPVDAERYPADWAALGGGAGFARNKHMVTLRIDRCVAFMDLCRSPKCRRPDPHPSHGAAHCADHAERAGIPTVRHMTSDLHAAVSRRDDARKP